MLDLHVERIGELAVVECEGRVVRSEAAFQLREAVTSLCNARIIVLDLSEVRAIEGGGLGMLLFLQRWAHDHDIQFKLSCSILLVNGDTLHPEMPPLWRAGGLGRIAAFGQISRRVSDAAIAWVQNCACQKPQELGYAQELWTYGLLTAHLRQQARSAGYPELEQVSRSKLHKILMQGELRPHKVRYYVERRDPEFESKMAAVLHVYKEVEILNE